jgi:hypothetical protein
MSDPARTDFAMAGSYLPALGLAAALGLGAALGLARDRLRDKIGLGLRSDGACTNKQGRLLGEHLTMTALLNCFSKSAGGATNQLVLRV